MEGQELKQRQGRAAGSGAAQSVKRKKAGAAEDTAAGGGGFEAEVKADGDGTPAAAEAPAAKRAKRAAPTRKPKAAKAGEEEEEENAASGGTDGEGAEGGAKAVKSRKLRANPAAKRGAAGAGAADEPAGAPGGEEGAASKPKPKPQAKRGAQKAEPLPQYSAELRKPPPPEGAPALKILSWNVAGLRALLKKQPDVISALVEREGVGVVCLQEHKLQGGHTEDVGALMGLQGWHHHWACSTAKLGYSGVSVHTRTKPLSVTIGLGSATAAASDSKSDPEHEVEGRVVTVELPDAFVVSVYVPNSGEGLKRLDYRVQRWDGALAAYLKGLQGRGKPVIVTGDLNCAHQEIDIHSPKTNLRSAGFTVEERESFGRLLLGEVGLVDTFRRLFPGIVGYTYFTRRFNCREKNKGWRLDYFLTSSSLMPPTAAGAAPALEGAAVQAGAAARGTGGSVAPGETAPPTDWHVYDSWILQDVYGSDHLPLGLTLVKGSPA